MAGTPVQLEIGLDEKINDKFDIFVSRATKLGMIGKVQNIRNKKPIEKYNYLTSDEANMSNEGINLQISLGLQSCKTKKDVCDLLEDIRTHERQKCLLKIALLKKKIRELPNRDEWIQKDLPIAKGVLDGGGISKFETLRLIDECFQIQEQDQEGK